MRDLEIQKFWDNQAKELGSSPKATNEDVYYRSLEILEIIKELGDCPGYVLDVGCGNGFSTKKFATRFPGSYFEGVDFSEAMIREAHYSSILPNARFMVMNALDLSTIEHKYDTIISERCLINLTDCEKQEQAILQMKRVLDRQGKLILVENTMDGLNRLNLMRERIGLHEIQVRWHNLYFLHQPLLEFLQAHFEHVEARNIGMPYYFLSRVVYAKYAQLRGIEPRYDNWMNRIACKLPTLPRWWASPNMMYVCTRKKP